MSTITSLGANDNGSTSRGVINTNFTNLNSDKIETSVLDTDGTLAANSDAKVATQKAVKAYVGAYSISSTSGVSNGPASSTTQTVTHGLGKAPTIIRVTAYGDQASSANSSSYSSSTGVYNASGNSCVFIHQTASGAVTPTSSTTYAIKVGVGNSTTAATGVIQNITSTTFDIVWTASADCSIARIIWEAQ